MTSSDQPTSRFAGRFSNLKRAAERIEAGHLTPHPEELAPTSDELRQSTAKPSSLREKLGVKKPASATVRMSVEMTTEMHAQVTAISVRAGIPKVEVVRQILAETLPDLI